MYENSEGRYSQCCWQWRSLCEGRLGHVISHMPNAASTQIHCPVKLIISSCMRHACHSDKKVDQMAPKGVWRVLLGMAWVPQGGQQGRGEMTFGPPRNLHLSKMGACADPKVSQCLPSGTCIQMLQPT